MRLIKYLLAGLIAFTPLLPAIAGWFPLADPATTPVSNACTTVSGTTVTFTAQGVGGANPNRITVVTINWDDSTNAGTAQLTAMTVGGISMSKAVSASSGVQNSNSEIWYVANPIGTTANIVVTFATAVNGVTIEVYSLVGYLSVPVAAATGTTTVSQTYNKKQVALASASRTVNVSTSLSNMVNDFSSACGASLWGVHASQTLNGNNQTLTSAINPTSNNPKIALALWSITIPTTPPGVASALAWYDASIPSNFTLSGSNIVTIVDRSGNGNNLGSVGTSATYSATSFNTFYPAISITASNTALSRDNVVFGSGNTLTVWVVGQFVSGTASFGRALSYTANGGGNTDANNNQSWLFSRDATTSNMVLYRNASTASALFGTLGTPHIAIGTIDSSGVITIYIDGAATIGSTLNAAFGSPGQLVLGNVLSASNSAWNGGLIAEAGVSTSFTNSTNVGILYNSLKAKWGL